MVLQEIQQCQTKRQETSIICKRENSLVQALEREMNSSRIPLGVGFQAKVTNYFICRTVDHQISLRTMKTATVQHSTKLYHIYDTNQK